jgi:hypothetical protein
MIGLRAIYAALCWRKAAPSLRGAELRRAYPLPRFRLAYRARLRVGLLPGLRVPRLLALEWRLRPRIGGG